jgi:hypothetical protein
LSVATACAILQRAIDASPKRSSTSTAAVPLLPAFAFSPTGSADSDYTTTPAAASARFTPKGSSPLIHVTSYSSTTAAVEVAAVAAASAAALPPAAPPTPTPAAAAAPATTFFILKQPEAQAELLAPLYALRRVLYLHES